MDTAKDEMGNRRAAEAAERQEEVVLPYEALRQFDFTSPVRGGDIIKIFSHAESVGTTSCKIEVWVVNARTNADVFRTFAIVMNVCDGKAVPLVSASQWSERRGS